MRTLTLLALATLSGATLAEAAKSIEIPKLLTDKEVQAERYLPDYSYAGYDHGESEPMLKDAAIVRVEEHGMHANDAVDDSKAFAKLLETLHADKNESPVVVLFDPGVYVLSDIIFIRRSNIVLRGAGSGSGGTTLNFSRPLSYAPIPEEFIELQEYIVARGKRERNAKRNIDHPFSLYSWSGGYIWTAIKGERPKKYLKHYDTPPDVLSAAVQGVKGEKQVTVSDTQRIAVGDVVKINWYNKRGQNGAFIKQLFPCEDITPGENFWKQPDYPLAVQQAEVVAIEDKTLTLRSPLLHDINDDNDSDITAWKHLSHVGIENFKIHFPHATSIHHHLEQGNNAIYLTSLYNGWVKDVAIENSDSGILTDAIGNVTLSNIRTYGNKIAHYSVHMGSVHNVLAENITVENPVYHSLSFNTGTSKCVFKNARVLKKPQMDQHAGANQQNLFDQIYVRATISNTEKPSVPLFKGSGAKYWKPTAGAYNTFWNFTIEFTNAAQLGDKPVLLYGTTDGCEARIVGLKANHPIELDYEPNPYVEGLGVEYLAVPSLYDYQLRKRLTEN